jgi:N-acetyl-anhydromuramyl-L-alanine amidase AmpD
MKVILTKKNTFITIIYHTKFQFAKMYRTIKKMHFSFHFLVHKNHRNSENYIFFIVLEIFANWIFVW